jgi:hypothetical protein
MRYGIIIKYIKHWGVKENSTEVFSPKSSWLFLNKFIQKAHEPLKGASLNEKFMFISFNSSLEL